MAKKEDEHKQDQSIGNEKPIAEATGQLEMGPEEKEFTPEPPEPPLVDAPQPEEETKVTPEAYHRKKRRTKLKKQLKKLKQKIKDLKGRLKKARKKGKKKKAKALKKKLETLRAERKETKSAYQALEEAA